MKGHFDYFYGVIGFGIGLIVALLAMPYFEGIAGWPKSARFVAALAAATPVCYVFGVLGLRLFIGFLLVLAACVAALIIGAVWHFV